MSRKSVILSACGVVLIAGAIAAACVFWPGKRPEPPAPQQQEPTEITKYLASEEFEKLKPEQKQAYFAGAVERFESQNAWRPQRDDLTDEEQDRLRKNAGPLFRKVMERRIEKYFEMPKEEKTAYLDEMIDRFEEMRKAQGEHREAAGGASAGAAEPRRRSGPRRSFTPERLRDMIENTPPATQARFVQFMMDMRKRREERGLPASRGLERRSRPPSPPPPRDDKE
ncbi:MAG: hypothetical protein ABIF82_06670 [Planctomycetota bacterium]